MAAPFSFDEILSKNPGVPPPPDPVMVPATDGVELAVFGYRPPSPPKAVVVFLHGGGAHSCAGYQVLAHELSSRHGVAVYTPDLRGHGVSGGPRGDSPSAEQVWRDVRTVLEYARGKEEEGDIPLVLGGHSSGGGLVINYATWVQQQQQQQGEENKSGSDDSDSGSTRVPPPPLVSGYLLVAPELGYRSGTARPGRVEFARVNVLAFIVNGITGFMGHNGAVRFNYPPDILEDGRMCSYNTVNMANAITPENPREQVGGMVPPLVGLWVGGDDELFDAEKVAAFVATTKENNNGSIGTVVPKENHLGIVTNAHKWLGPWIEEHVVNKKT